MPASCGPERRLRFVSSPSSGDGQGIALISASLQNVKRQGVVFRALKEDSAGLSMGIAVTYSERNTSPVLRSFLDLVRERKAGRP